MTSQALKVSLLDQKDDEYEPILSNKNSNQFNNDKARKEMIHSKNSNNNDDDSYSVESDFFQEAFGIGKFTEVVLEEITDKQDYFEAFFTTMFLIGCFLLPLILIFSDYIKPYDLEVILYIQNSSLYSDKFFNYFGEIITYFYSVKFHMSLIIFIYLAIDPGVAYKVAATAGMASYISFFLDTIIHDTRPYWISTEVKPVFCHITFGCPSVNVLSGLLYYNLLNFNLSRAIKAKDPFLEKNALALQIGSFVAKFYVMINVLVGFQLIANGEHFVYQIAATFFMGFIMIRVLIAFNKEIDYFTNGARYIVSISNSTVIWIFIYIMGFACFSWVIYSTVSQELLISKEYITNINVR